MSELLGCEVVDSISGFTGIADGYLRHLYGCHHIVIKPRKLDAKGDFLKPLSVDIQRVSVTPTGRVFPYTPREVADWPVWLGDKVKDKITGEEGVVVTLVEHLFDSPHAWLDPTELNPDGSHREGSAYPIARLDVLVRAERPTAASLAASAINPPGSYAGTAVAR